MQANGATAPKRVRIVDPEPRESIRLDNTVGTAPRLPVSKSRPANWASMTKAQQNAWQRERNVLTIEEKLVPWGDHAIPDFIAEHLLKVQRAWQKTIAATVETGKLLIEMKKELGHERVWLQVFQWNLLPFGERTAQMMMSVAKHPVLSNPHNHAFCPGSLNAQYLLSRMPGDTVTRLIEARTVTSTTTIAEVADLYVFKVPQLLPKLSKIAAAHDPASVATVAGYELWRAEQDKTSGLMRQLSAWLAALADALDREEEEHGEAWGELAREDERSEAQPAVKQKKEDAFVPWRGELPKADNVTVNVTIEQDLGDDVRYRGTAHEQRPTEMELAAADWTRDKRPAREQAAEYDAWAANLLLAERPPESPSSSNGDDQRITSLAGQATSEGEQSG